MSELLGEVVTWDLKSTEVSFHNVCDSLRQAGLDPDAAQELSPKSAFGRACKELKKERAIDKLEFEGGVIRFQFTKKHLDNAAKKVNYDYECVLSLDTDTGVVTCTENEELAKTTQQLLDFAIQTRNAQDVTRLVQKMFQNHADLFAINPRKGVAYFVPEVHREFTTKIDTFLHHLGGGLSRFPVPKGTEQGNASVRDAVQSGLAGLLAELNDAVQAWDDTTRKGTFDKATERWQIIKHKVDAYAEYLGAEQAGLLEKLMAAKQELAAKISQLHPVEDDEPASVNTAA